MTLILIGLVLWMGLHFLPAIKPRSRSWLIKSMGANAYAGSYTLGMVGSIFLMVMGWRSAEQWIIYTLPEWINLPGKVFIVIGVVLFGFGFDKNMKTNLKRMLRHLQLTGMWFWSMGHLMLNGDNRSVLLFGGLGLWALAMMALVNHRDGAWVKPPKVPLEREFIPAVIALAFVASFVFGHSYLSGISLV